VWLNDKKSRHGNMEKEEEARIFRTKGISLLHFL
jgi:hypothetical protein